MTRAPLARAISSVRSALRESSTTTSSDQRTDSRQAPMLISSLSVNTSTETDTGAVLLDSRRLPLKGQADAR